MATITQAFAGHPYPSRCLLVCLLLAVGHSPDLAAAMGKIPSVEIEQRSRFESLDGRLPTSRSDSDQLLALRTRMLASYRSAHFIAVTELMDSRQLLADRDSLLNNTVVNSSDILQTYLQWFTPGIGATDSKGQVQIGRFTKDINSRRLFARNSYRNTINSYTGIAWQQTSASTELGAFYLVPVEPRPGDIAALRHNAFRWDREQSQLRTWGIHGSRSGLLPGINGDALLIAIDEEDDGRHQTRDRQYLTLDFRLSKVAAPATWNFEIEVALQEGELSRNNAPNAATLDHRAQFYHAQLGYSFEDSWQTTVSMQIDYASGENNGFDDKDEAFDTLFGARRFDFGPTGIYGPFVRSNIYSPGLRLSATPGRGQSLTVAHRHYWDAQGISGQNRFQGRQTEFSLGWHTPVDWLQLETGGAWLDGASGQDDLRYFYFQLTASFSR